MRLNNPYDMRTVTNARFDEIQRREQEKNDKGFTYDVLHEGNCFTCLQVGECNLGRICLLCNVCLCKGHYRAHQKYHTG